MSNHNPFEIDDLVSHHDGRGVDMSPRERAEHNYEHMNVGDLVRHWDGSIGIILEIDPVEARIQWTTNNKGATWSMLYNLETLCDTSISVA